MMHVKLIVHVLTVKLNSQNWHIFWKIIDKARGSISSVSNYHRKKIKRSEKL